MISIIIPVFNRPVLIAECLDSVITQTYSNWECIVVDDGSTDNTWDILEDYTSKDNRIKIVKRNREPKGANVCRNIGAAESKASHILFFDSDDLFFPWCIERIIDFISNNADLEFGAFQQLVRSRYNDKMWYRCVQDTPENYLSRYLNFRIALSTACVWKKVSFYRTHQWNEKLTCWQDPPLIVSALLNQLRFYWITDEPLTMIRINSDEVQITQKLKLSKYLPALYDISQALKSKERRTLSHSIKTKLWEKGNQMASYKELRHEVSLVKKLGLLSLKDYFFIKCFFKVFFLVKSIPILRYLVYRSQFLFYKKIPFLF